MSVNVTSSNLQVNVTLEESAHHVTVTTTQPTVVVTVTNAIMVPVTGGTETDPVWLAEKTNYYTKLQTENLVDAEINSESTQRINGDNNNATALANHTNNKSNPHETTLEQSRSQNNQLQGAIDMNGNAINNLVNPSSSQQAVTKYYADDLLQQAISYTDAQTSSAYRAVGDLDASIGQYPLAGTGSGTAGAIRRGDTYRIVVAGTISGYLYDVGDSIYAVINTPGQNSNNWGDFEHNTQQATEAIRGTSLIVDAITVSNENSLDDQKVLTTKKLWLNFWTRVLALSWTWIQKQIFSVAPRFSSASANAYLKTDINKDLTSLSAIPPADISQDGNNRFVSDAEKTAWNEKQNALTFDATPTQSSNNPVISGGIKTYVDSFGTITNAYTTPGSFTWSKPNGAKIVQVILIGGGGGGGAGARRASGTATSGGAGGGGGGMSIATFMAEDLSATETVVVGSPGSGANPNTTDNTNGSAGGSGSDSSFGNYLRARPGAGGSGGSTATSGSGSGGNGMLSGGTGGSGNVGGAGNQVNANVVGPQGGASGGGISNAPAAFGGGNALAPGYINTTTVNGGGINTAGGNGFNNLKGFSGQGGAGGGASINAAAGAGGNGGTYGAAGAGGGSSLNTFNSGRGGNGAAGCVIVITTF